MPDTVRTLEERLSITGRHMKHITSSKKKKPINPIMEIRTLYFHAYYPFSVPSFFSLMNLNLNTPRTSELSMEKNLEVSTGLFLSDFFYSMYVSRIRMRIRAS